MFRLRAALALVLWLYDELIVLAAESAFWSLVTIGAALLFLVLCRTMK
jgi:hypothetical protein